MPLATTYTTGTASVTNGTTAVTGTGTEWLRTVRVGDFFGTHEGLPIRIASIEDDEALTLAYNWPGTTLTDDPYEILYADDASRATAQTRELIERMRALDVNTMGLFYEFSSATSDVDPGVGVMALNSGTLASVTEAYFDNIDANTTGRDVTGLLGLWDVGTTLLIRSIESTAYAAYTMTGPVSDETGYRKAESLTYVGSAGSFVDGEAIAVSWFGVGEGLQIDALGAFADRDDYDAEAEGFIYLSTDGDGSTGVSTIYRKNSAVSGDWSDGALFQGAAGNTGWSPKFGIATDGTRRVLQLLAYVGGTGTAPTGDINKYVSASGYTSTIGDAIDIRGSIGLTGNTGVQGSDGPAGWAPYFGIVTDGDRRVLQLAGYVGGGGTEPTDNVGDYVSVGGYTPTIGSAADIRGDIGLTGGTGADGTGPGVFFVWDADNADSDQGGGKIWANDDDLAVAVTVYVSKTNRGTDDVSTYLASLDDSTSTTSKGTLILTVDDATSQAIFDVTALTDASNYVKLTVVHQGGVTAFAANDIINLQFYPKGDRGDDGDGAFNGPGSAVDSNFLSFDGTSGNLGKDSGFGPDDFAYVGNNLDDLDDANVALDNLHVQGADIASASTVDLEAATGHFVDVTGTTTTTAITLADGHERWVRAAGAWPITVGASLVLNNGGSSYTCSAGDIIHFIADGTVVRGTVFRIDGQPMTTIGISKGGTGQTTAYAGLDALTVKGSDVASATTTDIGAATGEFIHITGTTTITGFGTKTAGVWRHVTFDGALTLTHNATSLILPGGANITTAAGDSAIMMSEGSGNWRCLQYTRADGTAVSRVVTLEQGASVAPTAEGRIAWDTDDNKLKVGDGSGTKTFSPDGTFTTLSGYGITDAVETVVAGDRVHVDSSDANGPVISIQPPPSYHAFGGQMRKLNEALTNPLVQFLGIALIGDSITWGTGATDTATSTPRDGSLSDPRDDFASASWANLFKRWIGETYADDATPTLSNWAASSSGEAIATYQKTHVLYPNQDPFVIGSVNPGSLSITEANSTGPTGRQASFNDGSAGTSYYTITFTFTGKEFTLWYASISGAHNLDYELRVNGSLVGTYSTTPSDGGNPAGTNVNSRTHTISFVKNATVEIRTKRHAGGAAGTARLRLEAVVVEKAIRITNQGIIGTQTRSYKSTNLSGGVDGDAVAADDSFAIVQLGTNDRIIVSGVPKGVGTLVDTLAELLAVVEPLADVILMNANKVSNEDTGTYSFSMQSVRDAVANVGKNRSLDVIDNYTPFVSQTAFTDLLSDDLHPSDRGHLLMALNIIGAIESA